jgi:hypothetical protein
LRGVADENFTGMLRAHGDVALRVTAALRTTLNNDGTIHGRDGGILSIGNEEIVNHADGVIQGDAIDSSVGIEFFGISGTRDSSSITNMGLIRGDTAIRAGSFFQVDLSMINEGTVSNFDTDARTIGVTGALTLDNRAGAFITAPSATVSAI